MKAAHWLHPYEDNMVLVHGSELRTLLPSAGHPGINWSMKIKFLRQILSLSEGLKHKDTDGSVSYTEHLTGVVKRRLERNLVFKTPEKNDRQVLVEVKSNCLTASAHQRAMVARSSHTTGSIQGPLPPGCRSCLLLFHHLLFLILCLANVLSFQQSNCFPFILLVACYVVQAGLEPTEIHQPLLPRCAPCLALFCFCLWLWHVW